ncbi:hypothetical protein AAGW18_01120 [Vreelandella titanicae]|uniref:hypothetical protein n=1 Tax=Vreelandella titanicae TaxID=664683 RepID=UPI00241E0607|nr:hypothetical protein [Halomonas titanicae]UEQ05303.1 hypothetical protein LMS44_05375 [Halomonas profundus]
MKIEWEAPRPRRGFAGVVDRVLGPGATPAELMLQLTFPLIAAIAAPIYAYQVTRDWSLLQYAVSALLAFDIVGGVVTNSTSCAKRWYHRPRQGLRKHLQFIFIHFIHLFMFSWLYLPLRIDWFFVFAGLLIGSALLILLVSQYLQRPIALITYSVALLLSLYALPQPVGMEWFLPLFYLKLLVAHLPKEEPYRPDTLV